MGLQKCSCGKKHIGDARIKFLEVVHKKTGGNYHFYSPETEFRKQNNSEIVKISIKGNGRNGGLSKKKEADNVHDMQNAEYCAGSWH